MQLEERLLTDSAFFEELLIVEDELIDEFLSGELTESERGTFNTHFLAALERQQKLRFARSLKKYVIAKAKAESDHVFSEEPYDSSIDLSKLQKRRFFSFFDLRPNALAYSLAAAGLVLVIGVAWIILRDSNGPPGPPGNVLTLVLTPGLTREGGEIKRLFIPPGTASVRLLLEFAHDENVIYRAQLMNSDGNELITTSSLKVERVDGRKVLPVSLDPQHLPPGDYRLRVSAISSSEAVESYTFRVLNRQEQE